LNENKLIVGIGNPGKEYVFTRHNLGFLVLERLAERLKAKFQLSSLTKGFTAKAKHNGAHVELLMPTTFVNNSGVAVRQYLKKNDLPPENILVVTDELNIAFPQIRIKAKGSDGGHNGLASIIYHLESQNFSRLRMGIGPAPRSKDAHVDYVLGRFTKAEEKQLDEFIDEAVECSFIWLNDGVAQAMDQFNRKTI